jgi:glycerol kinase
LVRWHEHDAAEIQEVCDKVIEQAISNLEEAGYMRSSVKVIGAPPCFFLIFSEL